MKQNYAQVLNLLNGETAILSKEIIENVSETEVDNPEFKDLKEKDIIGKVVETDSVEPDKKDISDRKSPYLPRQAQTFPPKSGKGNNSKPRLQRYFEH